MRQSGQPFDDEGMVEEEAAGPNQRKPRLMEAASGGTTLPLQDRLAHLISSSSYSDTWGPYLDEGGLTVASSTRIFMVVVHLSGATHQKNVTLLRKPP